MSAFSHHGFPDDVIALAVRCRWYVRYRPSYADIVEWLAERGLTVDHSTIYRWVQRCAPRLVMQDNLLTFAALWDVEAALGGNPHINELLPVNSPPPLLAFAE